MAEWVQIEEWDGNRNSSGHKTVLCKCSGCGKEKYQYKREILGTKGCASCSRKENDRFSTSQSYVFHSVKNGAKSRAIKFCLSIEEVLAFASQPCYYCGSGPSNCCNRFKETFYYNGIDRVDNRLGYIEGNCVSCCKYCNIAKRDRSVEDFLDHAHKIVQHSKENNRGENPIT